MVPSGMRPPSHFSRSVFCFLIICLFSLAGCVLPAKAEEAEYKKGDAVMVDLSGDGKEIYKGIVQEVYRFAAGISYSVKWDTGTGFKDSQTGSFPASRVRPQGGGQPKTVSPPMKPEPEKTPPGKPGDGNKPPGKPDSISGGRANDASRADVTSGDLDYFVGKWQMSKWGGGSVIERNGDLYKTWLLHVSRGAPLTVNADGTYEWTGADGKPLKGNWRKLTAAEDIIAAGKSGIMLRKGLGGLDWQMDFRGIKDGRDLIKLKSDHGSFDGVRIGASKGEPAWNKVQFAKGDAVVVTLGSENSEYNGVIDAVPAADSSGIIYYHVSWTEGGRTNTGSFQAIKIRRR